MKRFSSFISGLAPWIFAIAVFAFVSRFAYFGKFNFAFDYNYLLFSGIAVGIYAVIFVLKELGVRIAGMESGPIQKNSILNCFDCSVIMLILLLVVSNLTDMPDADSAALMCLASMLVAILSLIAERSGRINAMGRSIEGQRFAGSLLLIVIVLIIIGLSALIFLLAFGGIEQLAVWMAAVLGFAGTAALTAGKGIANGFEAILEWLSRFIKTDDVQLELEMPQESFAIPPDAEKVEYAIPGWVLYVLIGIIVILVIVFIVKNISLDGHRPVEINKRVRVKRSGGLFDGVKRSLKAFASEIRYRYYCIRYKQSPAGLLVYCERHVPKEFARLSGESGEAFIRRVGVDDYSAEFAELIEKDFYSGKKTIVTKDLYRNIIKSWNSKAQEVNTK